MPAQRNTGLGCVKAAALLVRAAMPRRMCCSAWACLQMPGLLAGMSCTCNAMGLVPCHEQSCCLSCNVQPLHCFLLTLLSTLKAGPQCSRFPVCLPVMQGIHTVGMVWHGVAAISLAAASLVATLLPGCDPLNFAQTLVLLHVVEHTFLRHLRGLSSLYIGLLFFHGSAL